MNQKGVSKGLPLVEWSIQLLSHKFPTKFRFIITEFNKNNFAVYIYIINKLSTNNVYCMRVIYKWLNYRCLA